VCPARSEPVVPNTLEMSASSRTSLTEPCERRGKTNFFEKRVGEYQKAGVMNSLNGDGHSIAFDADF